MEFIVNKYGHLVTDCETVINGQLTPIQGIVRKIAGNDLWLYEIMLVNTYAVIAARRLYPSPDLAKQQLIRSIDIGYTKEPNGLYELVD